MTGEREFGLFARKVACNLDGVHARYGLPYIGPLSEPDRLARQDLYSVTGTPPTLLYSPITLAQIYWYAAQLHVLERWALYDQVGLDRGLFGRVRRRDLARWIDTDPSRFPAVSESRAVRLLALALTPGVLWSFELVGT